MVFSTRLEYNLFLVPSHRPVNAPAELYAAEFADVYGFFVAAFAFVRNAVFAVVASDFSCVFMAFAAENSCRPINVAVFHFVGVVAVFVEALLDKLAVLHGFFHAFNIAVCLIAFRLIQEFRLDAYARKLCFNVYFVVARIVCVSFCCVRHRSNRKSQVLCKNFRVWHVCRNFSEYVVIVPRIDEAHVFAAVAQGTHY